MDWVSKQFKTKDKYYRNELSVDYVDMSILYYISNYGFLAGIKKIIKFYNNYKFNNLKFKHRNFNFFFN